MAKVPVRLTKNFRGRVAGDVMHVSLSNAKTMQKIKVGEMVDGTADGALLSTANVPQKKVAKVAKKATKKATKKVAKKAAKKTSATKSIPGTRNRSMRGKTETK